MQVKVLALTLGVAIAGLPVSHEEFTTTAFPIVPEDVASVLQVTVGSAGHQHVIVYAGACFPHRDVGNLELDVHGAPAAAFRAGDFVATGIVWQGGHGIASVRHLSSAEFAALHCRSRS